VPAAKLTDHEVDRRMAAMLEKGLASATVRRGRGGECLTVFRSPGITVDHTFGLGGDSLFQRRATPC
jgi:hypothetical protein